MDRYGYDTHDSHAYCIIDRKKNEHIATAYHVTTADKIVKALNEDEKMRTIAKGLSDVSAKTVEIDKMMREKLGVDIYGNPA